MAVERDWYYSPAEGEVSVNVTGMSEEEIVLVEKAIRAEFELLGGAEILIDQYEGHFMEWRIYKVVEL